MLRISSARVLSAYLQKYASPYIHALTTSGHSLKSANEIFWRSAGALTDVSKLRHQAVFLIGAGGSGKSFAGHRWMKYMPGGGGGGYSREQLEKTIDERTIDIQERGLSNLDFSSALEKIKRQYGIDIEMKGSKAKIPFRIYDYSPAGKREIPPHLWETELPNGLHKQIKGLSEVVFSTPIHELPSYWRQISPDIYKEELAGFLATKPGYVHEMSKDMAKAYFETVLQTGDPIFVESIGGNLDSMVTKIKQAKNAGYKVSLVLVLVPLTINQIRNATRSRNMNPDIITNKWMKIRKNFVALRGIVDKSKVVDNRNDPVDMALFKKEHTKINTLIKRSTDGRSPDLYSYIEHHQPKELTSYGSVLNQHRD